MRIRFPFAEPPFACEHQRASYNLLRSALRLKHYDLDNGYTVSILRVDTGSTAELWEAWAWPTTLGSKFALTSIATYHESEVDALLYRNKIAAMPAPTLEGLRDLRPPSRIDPPRLTDEQAAKLRADFERPHGR